MTLQKNMEEIICKKCESTLYVIYGKFRGVATKYLQNYIVWYVVRSKYLSDEVFSNTGRILNLVSHDRWAWDKYRGLIKQRYE
jgi:hypothetical protein